MGQAILSGALEQEGEIKVENDAGSVVGKILQTGVVSGSGQLQGSSMAVEGVITGHRLAVDDSSTLGCDSDTDIMTLAAQSLTLANDVDFNVAKTAGFQLGGVAVTSTAAELNLLDGITAGTVAASKAVIVDSNKDITGFRNVTATGYFEIGSAQLAEADMELIDDLTAGTVAASKAVTVDSNKDTSGFRNVTATGAITAGTSFIIGSADLNETDLEKLDGITNGTVAASKAVVADANKDFSGFRHISGSGNGKFLNAYAASLTQGRLVTAGASGLLEDQAALHYDDARSHGYLELRVSSSASGSAVLGDGYLNLADASDEPMFQVSEYASGSSELGVFFADSAVPVAAPVAGDRMLFQDASDDKRYKKETLGGVRDLFFGAVSGDATIAAGGALTIESAAVEHGMLNDNIISGQDELAHADILDADELMISDGGVIKRVGVDSLQNHYFGHISGDATVADGGALTIAAAAVHADMLNDDIISGQANLGGTGVDDADEFLFSDAGTVKALTGANLYGWVFSKVSGDATVASGGALTIADDAIEHGMLNDNIISGQTDIGADFAITDEILVSDNGTLRKADLSRFATMLAGAGLSTNNGQLEVSSNAVILKADGDTLAEGYNYFADSSSNIAVDLPAAPSVGDVVTVKAGDLTSNAILRVSVDSGTSHTIDGQTKVDIESPFGAVSLVYVVADNWRIV
tara:strand:+ start:47 stop:2137 length:2091 start_codon:yes stop_codon:yes gene_type:complete